MSEPDEIQAYIERYGPHFHEALTLKQDMEKYPSIAPSQRSALGVLLSFLVDSQLMYAHVGKGQTGSTHE